MTVCDSCRKPGHCCRDFVLNVPIQLDNWEEYATQRMAELGLPFEPVRLASPGASSNPAYQVRYSCPRLSPDGRCTDYENRPQVCKIYDAKSDPLCIEYVYHFKNIPIKVIP